jgi:hypothetical protein
MTFPQTIHFWIDQATRFISPQMVALEWILCAVAALLVLFARTTALAWLAAIEDKFKRLAARKRTAILLCGILPVILRLALLGIFPVSEPSIHDEFSHLLLADTLAHGRLSNPTHPMWQHFESIHIIQQPTYSSMYPPAQGMFLAAGQVLFHEPWVGVLLSVGLMFAAMCWMMQQWMRPTWAFYGTLIAILKFGVFGPWVNNYLGGPVSALGGALVIGSIPPLREKGARAIHSILFGIGLVILMNSRPFEGAFLTMAALVCILPGLTKRIRYEGWARNRNVWVPAALLVACGFAFTGFYSFKVTGNPLRMPYSVNRDTYGWPENLAFLPVRTVTSRHEILGKMYTLELKRREHLKVWSSFVNDIGIRVFENWAFFIGPLLTLPLLAAVLNFRNPRIRLLLMFIGLIAFLNLFQLVLYPYHLGPVVPVMFTLIAQGLCWLYKLLSRSRPAAGYALVAILPAFLALNGAVKQEGDELGLPVTYWERAVEPHGIPRAWIEQWLSRRPGKQLVIVRYADTHSPNQEWVYNKADIDGSKVVWAREMDAQSDTRLLDYFQERRAWLLEADIWPQHLVPYSRSADTVSGEQSENVCECGSESR